MPAFCLSDTQSVWDLLLFGEADRDKDSASVSLNQKQNLSAAALIAKVVSGFQKLAVGADKNVAFPNTGFGGKPRDLRYEQTGRFSLLLFVKARAVTPRRDSFSAAACLA